MYSYAVQSDGQLQQVRQQRRRQTEPPPVESCPPTPCAPVVPTKKAHLLQEIDSEVILIGLIMFLVLRSADKPDWLLLAALGYLLL